MQADHRPSASLSPPWAMESNPLPSSNLSAFLVILPDGSAQLYERQHMTAGDMLANFPHHSLSLLPSRPRLLTPDTALLPHNTYYLHPPAGPLTPTTMASGSASRLASGTPSSSASEAGPIMGRAAWRLQRRHGLTDQFLVPAQDPGIGLALSSSAPAAGRGAAACASLPSAAPGIVDPAFAAAASRLRKTQSSFPGPQPMLGSISQPFTRKHSEPRAQLPEELQLPRGNGAAYPRKPNFLEEEDVSVALSDVSQGCIAKEGDRRIPKSTVSTFGATVVAGRSGSAAAPKSFAQFSEASSRPPPPGGASVHGCAEDQVFGQLVPARRAAPQCPQTEHQRAGGKIPADDIMAELHEFLNLGKSRGPVVQRTVSTTAAAHVVWSASGTHTRGRSNSILEELEELETEDLTVKPASPLGPPGCSRQGVSQARATVCGSRRSRSIAEELEELEAEDLAEGHSQEIPIQPTLMAEEKERLASGNIIAKLSARFSKQTSRKGFMSSSKEDELLRRPKYACADATSPIQGLVQKESMARSNRRALQGSEPHSSWNAAATFYSFAGVGSRASLPLVL